MVSFIPLFIFGVITAKILFHYSGEKYSFILCAPFLGMENCRPLGDPNGNLYRNVKDEHPAWFDVTVGNYDNNASLHNFIMASTRFVPNAQIMSASPFVGYGPEVESFMGTLAGRRVMVKLGIQQGEQSIISGENIILYCNNLLFKAQEGEYTSQCYGDGWGGPVNYRTTGASRDDLDKLLASINKEVDSGRLDYDIYRIVMYPIFIYLFLLISFFAWISVKAVRFVKNG